MIFQRLLQFGHERAAVLQESGPPERQHPAPVLHPERESVQPAPPKNPAEHSPPGGRRLQ